jgi:hypothetical protein
MDLKRAAARSEDNQVDGGARDRKAVSRSAVMPRLTLIECLMRLNPSATGNGGGAATTEVETRKIEAQIAQ